MEFHAVILAGEGHRLSPFTSTSNTSGGIPKALLPVANKPLIKHALEWCEKGSFQKITVVATASTHQELKKYIEEEDSLSQPIEILANDSQSTGEIIASLAAHTRSDFIVLPCDFITDLDPYVLINEFRNRDSDVLISNVYYENNLDHVDKDALRPGVLVHTPLKNRKPIVLDTIPHDTISQSKYLNIRMAALWRYPVAVASTEILDSGISLCSHEVMTILNDQSAYQHVSPIKKSWSRVVRDFARRSWRHRKSEGVVTAHVLPSTSTFIRANNLSAYIEANRYIMRQSARSSVSKQPQPKGAATISPDSIVHSETTIGEKTTIKKSAIGPKCKIGQKCRITGCVIFDNVVISDDVFLENCLIGSGAVIESKTHLTGCKIEGNYTVSTGSQLKNEILQSFGMDDDIIYDDTVLSSSSDDQGATSDGSRWADEDTDKNDDEESDDEDDVFDRS